MTEELRTDGTTSGEQGHHEPAHGPHHHHGPTGLQKRRLGVMLVIALAFGGAAIGAGVLTGVLPNPLASHGATHGATHGAGRDSAPLAKVVRPKRQDSLPIAVDQIATVEPYYQADLRARASGIVKKVHNDLGDPVKKGQILIDIEVPESEQDMAKFAALVVQRERELKVSEARLKDAKAALLVSAATIEQRLADVQGMTATRDLKQRRFQRFKELAARGTVVGSVVDEEERDYLASDAAVTSAKANVSRARADYSESESKVEAAAADIELKQAQIEVAKKDLDRAKAVADYGKVRAPFDGVVVRRTVDPGSFVQNATTGVSEVLISVARVDIVTVSARFPDTVASSITTGTPALVRVDDLVGVTIAAKVTRFAPSVQNADRTMRVEVDLFNSTDEAYATLLHLIQAGGPDRPTKGVNDPAPVLAFGPGAPKGRRLVPGMTGSIRITLSDFGESYVLPSTAVYSRSGTTYILVVQDGKTVQQPVRVQLTDGKTVRVALVTQRQDADGHVREVLTELTGQEEIIVARQLGLGVGTAVKVAVSEW